jgi:DNA-binding CsgD family transcriptional regulator
MTRPPDPDETRARDQLPLTERELTVAQLVGQALTNRQIARRLALSPHTINFHLRQLYRKLGINNRVQLACLVTRTDPAHPPAAAADPPRGTVAFDEPHIHSNPQVLPDVAVTSPAR